MKLIDKLLKKLNTDRNTFFTYILTLVTIYLAVDRVVEMLIMIFTGVAVSYWNPIQYTLALACPVFAYAFAAASSYADTRATKVTLFYTFLIGLYIIALSMFVQGLNMGAWLLFISSPSYVNIVTNFSELIRPAFCAISLYLPLTTIYPFIKFIILNVDDTKTMIKSIWDFRGISLSDPKIKHNAYTCDLKMFKDFDDAKTISLFEESRYKSLLVCGASGSGKTAMVFEPMIAQDIEKKYFFTEASKELGFTALKTGIASLTKPYSNEYLNKYFNLNMLTPSFGKDTLFNTFVKKMVISSSPHNIYKNLGITYMSPDYETLDKMMKVCDNYNVEYNIIDPSQPEKSIGLNPFVYDDPTKIAIIISSALQGISANEADEMKDLYKEEISLQMLENLTVLLKVIYPKMHDGTLPNMEDLLTLLTKFDLVEKMCKILERDNELATKYQMELSYFRRTFFANGNDRKETESNAYFISSRLENLLRAPKIRYILCNRHTNINFDDALENGEVTFLCTRRGDSGKVAHKAFGLFFLISMQHAVLSSRDTEAIFTMYRKYRVATTISAQSIKQFSFPVDKDSLNSVVLANCNNKIYTGGSTPIDELEWWAKEIGQWKQWSFKQNYDAKTGEMATTLGEPKYGYELKVNAGRLQTLGQNGCGYKFVADNGKPVIIGQGIMSYLSSKYKEKHNGKSYDFSKYSGGTSSSDKKGGNSSNGGRFKLNSRKTDFVNDGEVNPIQNTPTKYSFDDTEGDIIIDLKNNDNN